jgi:hypothetical protein
LAGWWLPPIFGRHCLGLWDTSNWGISTSFWGFL